MQTKCNKCIHKKVCMYLECNECDGIWCDDCNLYYTCYDDAKNIENCNEFIDESRVIHAND